jgi:hypothetical protein
MELPKTATQEFYVHLSNYPELGHEFDLWQHDMTDCGRVCLGKISLTFDIPQDVDPIQGQINCLEKQIEKAGEEHMRKIVPLQRRIKELQAITHQV